MEILNNKTVAVETSEELKKVLEETNEVEYIYLKNDITLTSGITLNETKIKIIINGTYQGIKSTLTGMNSSEPTATIQVHLNTKEVLLKKMNIIYTNTNGVVYVPANKSYSVITSYDNVIFNGTELSYNPYGTTKITNSTINIEKTNETEPSKVCDSDYVIIGGNTNITSTSTANPLFYFRNNTTSPSIVFLCKSNIKLTTDTKEFMNGTNKLNFTILHDTNVYLLTGNGFATYSTCGANNVLIEERASLTFLETKHQRVPMWAIFGNFTMKEGSILELINSYESTPSDNYNLHFKGSSCKLTLDNLKRVAIYTKNASTIYTDNPLEFNIKCTRLNLWSNSKEVVEAGGITDLPEYSWYKDSSLLTVTGTLTNSLTAITSHNLTPAELAKLPDLGNFNLVSKKELSIGSYISNIHNLDSTINTISGHTEPSADILIKYGSISVNVVADSTGYFTYTTQGTIPDNTEIEFIINIQGSFCYQKRTITTPYDGELNIISEPQPITFDLTPISTAPVILPMSKDLTIKIVDSRKNSTPWKLYTYIDKDLTSQLGFILKDALVFKKFTDEIIFLTTTPILIYTGEKTSGTPQLTTLTYSKEKGPLLNLTDNPLEANEEYFANIYFMIEE